MNINASACSMLHVSNAFMRSIHSAFMRTHAACAAFMRHAHACVECGGGRFFSFVIYQFDSAACVDSNSRKITVLKNSCEGLSRMARVARARGARAHVRNVPSYVPPNSIVRNLESLDRCWCAHLFTLLIN